MANADSLSVESRIDRVRIESILPQVCLPSRINLFNKVMKLFIDYPALNFQGWG